MTDLQTLGYVASGAAIVVGTAATAIVVAGAVFDWWQGRRDDARELAQAARDSRPEGDSFPHPIVERRFRDVTITEFPPVVHAFRGIDD